jgi:hypothetical protein
MMHSIFAIVLSMAAAIPLVNASAEDLPIGNQSSSALKDSINEHPGDLSRLIALLMKTGADDKMPDAMSPVIGLTGSFNTKGRDFTVRRGADKERRECSIVFPDDAGAGVQSGEKRPTCLYIQHKTVSGHDGTSHYYRFSSEGKLEHASILNTKFDEDGKIIAGSGVTVEKDINSPDVQKSFKAELAYWTKEWVKTEKKALARPVAAPSASPAH